MKKVLPFILLGAAGLLLCVGVGALALNFFGMRGPSIDTSKWLTPQQQVETQKIVPGVALAILAGTSDSASVDDSLAAGDFEGAFAQIAYGSEFSDANRVGTLLLLGNRYAAAKQTAKAAWLYEYAVFLAKVSPLPSDLNRAQTLLEAAQGLEALNMESNARAALDQAFLIAQHSFAMPRDTRADVLEQVARAYEKFGAPKLAQDARRLARDTITLPDENAINISRRPFRIQPTEPPANPEIVAKLKERIAAARELVDALNLNPPKTAADMPEELVRALGDKLYEEDALRLDYYTSQYDQAADASEQLGVLRDKLNWLAIKNRIARKGYGMSLVPEWEDQAQDITQEMNDTYADYFAITQQQAEGLDKADEANRSAEDILRGALVAGRWGLYPQYDEADLRAQLDGVSQALRDEQVASLRLDSFTRGNQIVYLLVPDELYGMGERALPR
ncbi:MAG: hypothetical protein HY741_14620 [Chloroflexi bacterium]|nr:hypothetical protein [Chloroflexota bacterium]